MNSFTTLSIKKNTHTKIALLAKKESISLAKIIEKAVDLYSKNNTKESNFILNEIKKPLSNINLKIDTKNLDAGEILINEINLKELV